MSYETLQNLQVHRTTMTTQTTPLPPELELKSLSPANKDTYCVDYYSDTLGMSVIIFVDKSCVSFWYPDEHQKNVLVRPSYIYSINIETGFEGLCLDILPCIVQRRDEYAGTKNPWHRMLRRLSDELEDQLLNHVEVDSDFEDYLSDL